MSIKSLKGMNDLIPPESLLWSHIQKQARTFFEAFGFSEIITPVVEMTELFSRSVGQTTDIIEKQMYTFEDKNKNSLSLRPEGTAPVVRAYLEHQLYNPDPYKKFYYWGPMYRYERMQKGRYRQFYQFGVEIFGAESARIDAETIYMLSELYRSLGLLTFDIQINSLGCLACRPPYREKLLTYLTSKKKELCEDCNRRVEKNPLRTFDCKSPSCQRVTQGAPKLLDCLCTSCAAHFSEVKRSLGELNTPFTVNPQIVRGLDYYVKTAFEIVSQDLGAQDALGGGGRYDGLVKSLGGSDIAAFGFAGGVERLVLALSEKLKLEVSVDLFIAALGEKAQSFSFAFVNKIRLKGIRAEIEYGERPLKALLKKADRLQARFTLMIGDEELDRGEAILRNMKTKEQRSIPFGKLLDEVTRTLRS